MVGLLEKDEECPPPRTFEDLNRALEACENELLLAFKQRSEQLALHKGAMALSMSKLIFLPSNPKANSSQPYRRIAIPPSASKQRSARQDVTTFTKRPQRR